MQNAPSAWAAKLKPTYKSSYQPIYLLPILAAKTNFAENKIEPLQLRILSCSPHLPHSSLLISNFLKFPIPII